MTKEALDRKLPIAMAMPIEGELDERGRPKVRGVAGVGKIVRHEPLPDGRSNVLLLGLGRVRIERELEVETPFRQVQATLTRSRVDDVSRLDSLMMSVRALAMAIRAVEPKVATELERMMDPAMGKEVVVDRIASVFLPNPSQRQTLLEEPVVEKRLGIVVDRLAQYLVQLRMERGGGEGLLH
jgi:Lon protease-like protein